MQLRSKKGFTLIELMVVIAIMGLLMLLTYAPYRYYQKKAQVKLATREVSQSFYEAKNMAVSGIGKKSQGGEFSNSSIGLVIQTGRNPVSFYNYDYTTQTGAVDAPKVGQLLGTTELQQDIEISEITAGNDSPYKILLFYQAISGDLYMYNVNGNSAIPITSKQLSIKLRYKTTSNQTLMKEIVLHRNTNIVDYK